MDQVMVGMAAARSHVGFSSPVAEGEYKIVEEEKKVRDGEGVFINGKERYEGAWKDDVMTGKGTTCG